MNWNIVEGNWKQFKGEVKAQWGRLTDDHLAVIAGKRTQLAGKIQEAIGPRSEATIMPYAQAGEVKLHYESFGSGVPFLFVSGTGWPGEPWKLKQVPALAEPLSRDRLRSSRRR